MSAQSFGSHLEVTAMDCGPKTTISAGAPNPHMLFARQGRFRRTEHRRMAHACDTSSAAECPATFAEGCGRPNVPNEKSHFRFFKMQSVVIGAISDQFQKRK